MFTCQDVSERASAFHDRDLPAWEQVKLRLHWAICRDCRRFVDQISRTPRLLSGSFLRHAHGNDASEDMLQVIRSRIPPQHFHSRNDG